MNNTIRKNGCQVTLSGRFLDELIRFKGKRACLPVGRPDCNSSSDFKYPKNLYVE